MARRSRNQDGRASPPRPLSTAAGLQTHWCAGRKKVNQRKELCIKFLWLRMSEPHLDGELEAKEEGQLEVSLWPRFSEGRCNA